MSATRKRRSPRGKGRRGDAWQGNAALERLVLTTLRDNPLPEGEDVVRHFGVADDKRATVQQTIARLLREGSARWSPCGITDRNYLVSTIAA